jgi:flagellin-like hook-associated protein FlgL
MRFSLNGVNVDIGDTFEFTIAVGDPDDINNQKYYIQNPDAPHDLPPYREYKVRYTVTSTDYDNGVTDVDAVADKLREAFGNLDPQPPVSINAAGSGAGIELTSNSTQPSEHPNLPQLFSASAKMTNGSLENTISVATLPPEATAITDVPGASPPDLPFYDTDYLTKRKDGNAWNKASVTVEDNYSITYGVVSTDPAFQTLISAFRMARTAASNPGKYEEYVTQSRALMSQAKDQLRSVHAKLSSDAATLEEKKTFHQDSMATVTERIAGIEGINQTEVAARLSSSMNSLQAAYTVAGQTQKLSLLNYLA